jgi:hypothetical protein
VTSEKNYNYFGSNIKVRHKRLIVFDNWNTIPWKSINSDCLLQTFPPIALSDEILTSQSLSTKKIVYTKIYNLAQGELFTTCLFSYCSIPTSSTQTDLEEGNL